MGILPVKYEIHKRQLSFLHHIIHLSDDDPVRNVWKYQGTLPEYKNWWTGVKELMLKYSINFSEDQIKEMSKESYKEKVKKAVKNVAFEELKAECRSKGKTEKIKYTVFTTQKYITSLYPNHSRIIFKCRSKTLDIKEHMQYKYKDGIHCRWCGISDETVSHIVNCGYNGQPIDDVEEIIYGSDIQKMKDVAERIEDFIERVDV